MKKNHNKHEQGFTLVELAIVLVIIGLIIGGILVGQDMIKSAEIRATIGQWEKYNTAVNVFKDKYAYIPGDINQTRAAEYGLYDRTGVAAPGNGDGNGLLQACSRTAAAGLLAGCETTVFWRDLNDAGLVDGWFQTAGDAFAAVVLANIPDVFPLAKTGNGTYWTAYSTGGRNWFNLGGITAVSGAGVYTLTNELTPFEAFNIDRKVDDARPLTGGVRAMEGTAALDTAAAAGPATCVFTGGVAYNQTTEALANTRLCQIRMRMN